MGVVSISVASVVLAVADSLKACYWDGLLSKNIIINECDGKSAYICNTLGAPHERRGSNEIPTTMVKTPLAHKIGRIGSVVGRDLLCTQLHKKFPRRFYNSNNAMGGSMSNIAYYGAIAGWVWYQGFNIILVLILSVVAFVLTERERAKAGEKEKELKETQLNSETAIQKIFNDTRERVEKAEAKLQKTEEELSLKQNDADRDKANLTKQIERAIETGKSNRKLWQERAERAEEGLKKIEQDLTSKQSELDNAQEEADRYKDNYYTLRLHYQELLSHKDAESCPTYPNVKFADVAPNGGEFTTIGSIEEVKEVHKELHLNSENSATTQPRTKNSLKKELDDYLNPLHWALVEEYYPLAWVVGIRYLLSIPLDDPFVSFYYKEKDEQTKSIEIDKIKTVLNAMRSYLDYKYAQPKLKELITQYLLFREKFEEIKDDKGKQKSQQSVINLLNEMAPLVEKRYEELMDEVG